MNRLTEKIDTEPHLLGLAKEFENIGFSSVSFLGQAWYKELLYIVSAEVWNDYWLSVLDLIAEVDDETLDAIFEEVGA